MNRWDGSIIIDASLEETWQTLIARAQTLAGGTLEVGSKYPESIYYERAERDQEVETEVTELIPNKLFQIRRTLKDEEDATAILTWSLEELPDRRTEFSLASEVEGELKSTPWPSDKDFEEHLKGFKKRVESN